MHPIRRILVAFKNLPERSLPAIVKAAQLARALEARLELFHALTASIYVGFHVALRSHRERLNRREGEWKSQ